MGIMLKEIMLNTKKLLTQRHQDFWKTIITTTFPGIHFSSYVWLQSWPVAQKKAETPGQGWACCSSDWSRDPSEPNGRRISNNDLSPSAFG